MDAKKLAANYNYLIKNNIDSVEKLDELVEGSKSEYKEVHTAIRDTKNQISDLKEIIKCAEQIKEYKDTYQEYVRSGKSADFRESHRAAIILYESAQDILKAKYPGRKSIALSTLNKELSDLEIRKIDLSARLSEINEEKSNLQTVKKNIDILMEQEKESKGKKKEHSR